jgi:Cytochrome c554 and c-prime
MHDRRCLVIIVAALYFGVASALRAPTPASQTAPPASPIGTTASAHPIGIAGCAARGCHGAPEAQANGPSDRLACSFTTWARHDRHARAFQTLETPLSAEIVCRLAHSNEKPIPAKEDERCLACHGLPYAARDTRSELHHNGVSCEACHGPASRWETEHITTGWAAPEGRKKRSVAAGMTWLNDLASRAETCAGCHLGAPGDKEKGLPLREVNHDLIAAGHPRLTFEFAVYSARMPLHWDERDRTRAGQPLVKRTPLEEWEAGQLASARAGLALLADRAHRAAASTAPWPEFAELDCYACHGDLNRRDRAAALRDRPAWTGWYWSLPHRLLDGGTQSNKLHAALAELMSRPTPPPRDVQESATRARDGLMPPTLRGSPPLPEGVPLRWDDAAQFYYAYAAAFQSRPKWQDLPQAAPFRAGWEQLRFRRDFRSPHGYDPAAVLKTLNNLRKELDALGPIPQSDR